MNEYPHVPVGSILSRREPAGKRTRKCACGSGKRAKSCNCSTQKKGQGNA